MHDRINARHVVVVGLIVLVTLFFSLGASSFDNSQSTGRFQLVVRHADRSDAFVIDTATGQVWSTTYTGEGKPFYDAKLSQDQQTN